MYKLKTSKSIKKRFKVTSSKHLMRHKSGRSHLLQKKSSKSKRQLRRAVYVSSFEYKVINSKIQYYV